MLPVPIDTAFDDDRRWTYILSDLHIDEDGGPALDAFERVMARVAARGSEARAFILGDLFEFYAVPSQIEVAGWKRLGDAIKRAVAAGASVTVLRGNRDFALDHRFARRTGTRVVTGGITFDVDGRRVLALHGDELCLRDHDYLKLRRWMRSPPMMALSHVLPRAGALWLGRRIRRSARKSQERRRRQAVEAGVVRPRANEKARDPWRFEPVREAIADAFERSGAEILVFGHIHQASRTVVESSREVLVLPAFEGDEGHLLSGPDHLLRHVRRGDEPLEVGGRTFPGLHEQP